jgi:hypothetical protein
LPLRLVHTRDRDSNRQEQDRGQSQCRTLSLVETYASCIHIANQLEPAPAQSSRRFAFCWCHGERTRSLRLKGGPGHLGGRKAAGQAGRARERGRASSRAEAGATDSTKTIDIVLDNCLTAPSCHPCVYIGAAGLPAPEASLSTDTRPPFIHRACSCANRLLLCHAQAQFVRRSSLFCLASELLSLARG